MDNKVLECKYEKEISDKMMNDVEEQEQKISSLGRTTFTIDLDIDTHQAEAKIEALTRLVEKLFTTISTLTSTAAEPPRTIYYNCAFASGPYSEANTYKDKKPMTEEEYNGVDLDCDCDGDCGNCEYGEKYEDE